MSGEVKGSPASPTQFAPERAVDHRRVLTVLHADLSGSTPLAERLDPEELRGIIGTFFNALAHEIRRFGGSIDKYIGDAVRAVFEGPISVEDDARRAVAAALAMQEAIARENEELERRYGVRLALRIGVSTGEVVSSASGADGQSTEALAGEAVTIAQRLEGAAVPNTVLASSSTERFTARWFDFAAVPPVPRKDREGVISAFRVVARKESPVEAPDARTTTSGRHSASLQVTEEKAHALEEQRKVVTVLFADLAAPLPTGLRPEQVRDVLAAYFGTVAREIRRYGGTIDKFVGDAVMAVFGAPISHEDDAARAVHAALAIRREIAKQNEHLLRDFGVELATRIGVNTGEVVAGLLAGEVLAYTITGDAVNTAQRIESAATGGEILVGEGTRTLARHAFVFEAVPPLTLKGKAEPVPAYRVIGIERRASGRGGAAMVGRQQELGRLFELLRAAGAGNGQVVHVFGEAGVGKTRLVSEFLADAGEGVGRMRARASSYETSTPYALVADLIRRTFHILRGEEEAKAAEALATGLAPLPHVGPASVDLLLEVLGYPRESALPPDRKRTLLISVLVAYLRHRTAARPAVVAVEDVHWIDATSTGVLHEVVKAVPEMRCLFLSTGREEASAAWPSALLPLAPLDSGLANEMLDRVAGRPLDEKVRALILERTGGNPFFIEEIAGAIATGRTTTVPATVRDLLESKVDALDAGPKHVAQRAAVIGRTFWTRVLGQVTPGEPLEPALATLEQERFVTPHETQPELRYIFRHALLQEVLYETQLLAQRRTAHAEVGGAIEHLFRERVDEYVDILAFHYDRSEDDSKAITWNLQAGDRARRLYANEQALSYYEVALRRSEAGVTPVPVSDIYERIGDVRLLTGHYDEAIESFRSARARSADGPRAARPQRKIGVALRTKGAYDEALTAFTEARETIGAADHIEGARIAADVGQLHFRRGDPVAAEAEVTRAVELGVRLGDDAVVAEGLKNLGSVAHSVGDLQAAADYYRRSLELYERTGELSGVATLRMNLGQIARRMGRWDESRLWYESSLELWRRIGDPWGVAASHNNVGELYRSEGRPAEALPSYERALSTLDSIGAAAEAAVVLMNRGAARVESGDVEGGRQDLFEAQRRFSTLGRTTYLPGLYRYLASAELAAGRLDAAVAAVERSLELARASKARHFEGMALRVLGEILLAKGVPDEALAQLEESRRTLAELGETAEVVRTDAVLARLSAR